MSNQVYANGREIACKAGSGKSICAFPDVCFTPPLTLATPPGVPIPYPNTGLDSDTTSGSTTVKISGKEAMLKNQSYFRQSTGDEAGCAPKKGVVTSVIRGKVYFKAWSMDVKFEGENVVRHLDLTTHNHASDPGQTPPWPFASDMMRAEGGACHDEAAEIESKCSPEEEWQKNCPEPPKRPRGKKNHSPADWDKKFADYLGEFTAFAEACKNNPCVNARKCMLVPYSAKSTKKGCCPGQTGDHLVDAASFLEPGTRSTDAPKPIEGWGKYDAHAAPCACAEGPSYYVGSHGQMHSRRGVCAVQSQDADGNWPRDEATRVGAKALTKVFPSAGCSPGCIEEQLNAYHDEAKDDGEEKPIRASASMGAEGRSEAAADMDLSPPAPPAAIP
ncbi:MAG: PAAR-like domain-containing protein [Lautropia sp.]